MSELFRIEDDKNKYELRKIEAKSIEEKALMMENRSQLIEVTRIRNDKKTVYKVLVTVLGRGNHIFTTMGTRIYHGEKVNVYEETFTVYGKIVKSVKIYISKRKPDNPNGVVYRKETTDIMKIGKNSRVKELMFMMYGNDKVEGLMSNKIKASCRMH